MKKHFKYLFFLIFIMLIFCGKVNAETYNPRYATINGSYLWEDGRIKTANRIMYGITNNSNTQVDFCITPSFYRDIDIGDYDSYYYGYIETCTTGMASRDGWWQASGTGYAQLEGWLDYSETCTVDGNTGHKQRVYFHLLDFTTPSGGADFSWSCFRLANDNYGSGYYNVAQINNIILTDKSYYKDDKEKQEEINRENQSLNNQQTQIQQNEDIKNKLDTQLAETEYSNRLNEQQIQQNTDAETTRKGMWETLKSMLNYINPLSEDFFAYKLVELFLNMLKSLFIPEDMDFVTNFVDALESKLGFIAAVPVAIIEFIMDLANATWTEFKSIQLPSISIFGYNFWNAQEIDLTEAINIFKPFKYVTDVICVAICAQTLNKWRERFTGGGAGK